VNAPEKWPTNKMAYYRSVGQSVGHNDWEANYRKNTWFPCYGIMENGSTFERVLKNKNYKNWIIKSVPDAIFQIKNKWKHVALQHMDYSPIDKKPEWSILPYLKKEMIDDNVIFLVMDNIRKCISALKDYCDFWWQVQISAQLGGGLWEIVPIFRKYVLSYNFDDYSAKKYIPFVVREKPLEELKIVFNVPEKTKNNKTEINTDLKNQGAFMELLIRQDFRPYIKQLKRMINHGATSKMQLSELNSKHNHTHKHTHKHKKSKKSTRRRKK
jgi:hypothetical protein